MPAHSLYLVEADIPALLDLLGEDAAAIVGDGPGRWRATHELSALENLGGAIWHVPSGALPLLAERADDPDGKVADPWNGWIEKRAGAEPNRPYFGAGHPGIVWLDLNIAPRDPKNALGLSALQWIGNRYAVIGRPAPPLTALWWSGLGRKLRSVAIKVPRGGLAATRKPDVWAFPHAAQLLNAGASADENP